MCPVPEVAEALAPFIKTRDEVASIRQELQHHLRKQLGGNDKPLVSTNVHLAKGLQSQDAASTGLSGICGAYMRALEAHQSAQAKYDTLKAELEQMAPTSNGKAKPRESVGLEYLPVLRQREKLRKLQVLDRTLSTISSPDHSPSMRSVDDYVRRVAGERPSPPAMEVPASKRDSDVDQRVLELKKAVLSTKRRAEERAARPHIGQFNGTTAPGSAAQVAGLQAALNELTAWMEQQLSIIGEPEAQNVPESPLVNGHTATAETASIGEIEALYDQYVSTRYHLIQAVNNRPLSGINLASDADHSRMTATRNGSITTAEVLLPYIQYLNAAKQEEQSLLQQGGFLRRQITGAEAETAKLIARLAHESHLVQPGATRGEDWARAAADASKTTTDFVMARVSDGEASVRSGEHALAEVRHAPVMLDSLVDS